MCKFLGTVGGFRHWVLEVVKSGIVSILIIGGMITNGKSMIIAENISMASSKDAILLTLGGLEAQETVSEGSESFTGLTSLKPIGDVFGNTRRHYNKQRLLFVRASSGDEKLPEVVRRKTGFIRFILPLIQKANELIRRDRNRILDLRQRTERGWALSPADGTWLASIAERYGTQKIDIRELLVRVDIVPPSLAIAQAAEESGWGTSRFAIEGNALFGQRIYRPGNNGMVPHKRPKGKSFKVRAFAQLIDGVKAYVHNLNSHFAYKKFREQRAELRAKKREISGYLLAGTLTQYSERGSDYVNSIRLIIRANALGFFDSGKLWLPEFIDLRSPDT